MRRLITEFEYANHLSNDLREAFELWAGPAYLEVIKAFDGQRPVQVIGRLIRFNKRCPTTSASEVLRRGDGIEAIAACLAEGSATEEYLAYQNLDRAREHALELLSAIPEDA